MASQVGSAVVEFLTNAWAAALDESLATMEVPPDVELTIEYRAGEFAHRLVIAGGRARVTTDFVGEPDVRISADSAVASAISAGEQSALEAFMEGDVVVGGDLGLVMANQELLETLGSAFSTATHRSD